jgi:predicted NUDIX family NTP pyrophosphohydrolase
MIRSAGILLFRTSGNDLEVLIGHPGGPFWANRSQGAWSIPKGVVESGEDPLLAALREFAEETGHQLEPDETFPLGATTLASGKEVVAWGVRGDLDPATAVSNPVVMEWPRGTGHTIEFPEIDQVRWCSLDEARDLLNNAQEVFLVRLQESLDHPK